MPQSHFDHLNDAERVDETNQSVVSDKVHDDSTRSETGLNCENAENKEKIRKTEWICYYTIFTLVLSIAIATTATLFSYRSYQNDQQIQFDTNVSVMYEWRLIFLFKKSSFLLNVNSSLRMPLVWLLWHYLANKRNWKQLSKVLLQQFP